MTTFDREKVSNAVSPRAKVSNPLCAVALVFGVLATCLLQGCKSNATDIAPGPAASASAPRPIEPASRATSPAPAPAPRGPATKGGIDEIYRGTIGKSPVVLRLHGGDNLHGEYFYESRGESLILDGSRNPSGEWTLQESVGGKVTGRFEITPSGQSLKGAWRSATKPGTLEVSLERVPRTEPSGKVLVLTRHLRGALKPNAEQRKARYDEPANVDYPMPPDGWEKTIHRPTTAEQNAPCVVDIAFPELAGLAAIEAESAINASIRRETGADSLKWPSHACSTPHRPTFDVVTDVRGLFSYCYGLGPLSKRPFSGIHCTTYDVRTGEAILPRDLPREESRQAWSELVHRAVVKAIGQDVVETLAPAIVEAKDLAVSDCGILVTPFADLGRAGGPVGYDLYEIPFAKLIPMTSASSPVATYAKGAAAPCRDPRAVTSL